MKHVFTTPYVYTTPSKVESTKSEMDSFDEFKGLEIEKEEVDYIPKGNGFIKHRHIIFKEKKDAKNKKF